ncbi:catalase [Danaus plexippus plexippus]|uniref:Catalase n=1 Tax=Danaus plexippus plexippus TaxID=278856 RepID=A0A212ET34_DANPL|nr:catalase [Danaus plexippus plexippus]
MKTAGACGCLLFLIIQALGVFSSDIDYIEYLNRTDPTKIQLYEFRREHPNPIGILTTSAGKIVEIRETKTLNSEPYDNSYFVDLLTHWHAERVPERIIYAKAAGAFGYFEVTNDVSKYTKAEVFNGVGKKTPVMVRVSTMLQNRGGTDLARESKGFSVKFYTKEGNLDLLCLNMPVFFLNDPIDFPSLIHALKRNPKPHLYDFNMVYDLLTKRPFSLYGYLWTMSDFGIPNTYRRMDAFAIHTYEINNKFGDRYFVKFNFRTEQGIENLPSDVAEKITVRDPDYYKRDLYNVIEKKQFPSWILEMDVMSLDDIKNIDYNPFDVGRIWKNGTYCTVPIGRLVLNRNPENAYRVAERVAFNPANLVPGIPGPQDLLFKARRQSYREAQIYRLGVNYNKIMVNAPLYSKVYNRDGVAPVRDNMKDAPIYYPNSFSGPVPYVDPGQSNEKLIIYESNAVDLEQPALFYNKILRTDEERTRLAKNIAPTLVGVYPEIQKRLMRLLTLIDHRLGKDVEVLLAKELKKPHPKPPKVLSYSRNLKSQQEFCPMKPDGHNNEDKAIDRE